MGHLSREQERPSYASAHLHSKEPAGQEPWPPHTFPSTEGQARSAQLAPPKPGLQMQLPALQNPLELHSSGQDLMEQFLPDQPAMHWHTQPVPFRSSLPLWQCSAQQVGGSTEEQSSPPKPQSHTQRLFLWSQRPLPLQAPGQAFREQSGPVQPGEHMQVPFEHSPPLWQPPAQPLSWQSKPEEPALHTHLRVLLSQLPFTQLGHTAAAQSSPPKQPSTSHLHLHSPVFELHLPW